jgi:hypothetical protein
VKVEAVVAPDGSAKTVEIKGGHPLLAQAAHDAVQKWKWVPAPKQTHETDRGQVQSVAQSRPNGRAVFCEVHPRGPKFNRGQTTMIVRRSSSVPQVP